MGAAGAGVVWVIVVLDVKCRIGREDWRASLRPALMRALKARVRTFAIELLRWFVMPSVPFVREHPHRVRTLA